MPIRIVTLSGASGTGKSTVARKLLGLLPDQIKLILSTTTRAPRNTDIPGEYEYLKSWEFGQRLERMDFAWIDYMSQDRYGTRRSVLLDFLAEPPTIGLMILTPPTVLSLRNFLAGEKHVRSMAYSFYFLSPPEEELYERLKERGDAEEKIRQRIAQCRKWDDTAKNSGVFDEFLESERGELPNMTDKVKNAILEFYRAQKPR